MFGSPRELYPPFASYQTLGSHPSSHASLSYFARSLTNISGVNWRLLTPSWCCRFVLWRRRATLPMPLLRIAASLGLSSIERFPLTPISTHPRVGHSNVRMLFLQARRAQNCNVRFLPESRLKQHPNKSTTTVRLATYLYSTPHEHTVRRASGISGTLCLSLATWTVELGRSAGVVFFGRGGTLIWL